jgi:L-amino acid N-acyltransferase YncA
MGADEPPRLAHPAGGQLEALRYTIRAMTSHRLVECTADRHAGAILDIFNEAILNSTAIYEYEPRTPEWMVGWFEDKRRGNYPVVGIEDAAGQLLGFATYGVFRARPAYKYSVEHSVYVHTAHRGKGVGKALLNEVIGRARAQGYHVLVGGIDLGNEASIVFHERAGFTHAGTVRQVAFKFGRWLDLAFYQLILDTPANPLDG